MWGGGRGKRNMTGVRAKGAGPFPSSHPPFLPALEVASSPEPLSLPGPPPPQVGLSTPTWEHSGHILTLLLAHRHMHMGRGTPSSPGVIFATCQAPVCPYCLHCPGALFSLPRTLPSCLLLTTTASSPRQILPPPYPGHPSPAGNCYRGRPS